jgi:hypothetical protein
MSRHIMVDLETWGTTPGCDIRSIGAVVFDPVEGTLGDEFYVNVIGGHLHGLTKDPATEQRWSEQSEEAQARLRIGQKVITQGILDFYTWWNEQSADLPDYVRFWAHGPHFDEQILAAAIRAAGVCAVPWNYRAPRDLRTVLEAVGLDPKNGIPSYGVEHNALDDAKAQALGVIEAYKRLKSVSVTVSATDLDTFYDTMANLALLRREHDRRVTELLVANNREVERRRGAEELLREAAGIFRFYEESHRSRVSAAAPESSPDELGENAARLAKAERNAAIAGRIETFLNGVTA